MVRGLEVLEVLEVLLLTFLINQPGPGLTLNDKNDRMLDINEADQIKEVSELPETGGLTLNLDDKSKNQIDLEKVPDVETEV